MPCVLDPTLKNLIIFEGFDFDAFLRDSAPDANKPTNASGVPGASVAPPPVSQMNETDAKTKQCTREDKENVSRWSQRLSGPPWLTFEM